MTREEFNEFCGSLTATVHAVQWGDADVWKVADKVFAVCGWRDEHEAYTCKAGEIAYEVLKDKPGIRPAPYLASRGMKWLQVYEAHGMNDADLKDHILISYDLVARGLSRKKRKSFGIALRE